MIYPVVRPSITLAYSTLWRPNGRELHSTPLKWSNDQLEYHNFLLFLLFPVCEESPHFGISRPYNKDQSEITRVREGSNTHKFTAIRTHTAKTWAQMNSTKFTTRTELKSLRMSIECAKTECEWLRMIKVCFVFSSMRLGVPFIAPRQLGTVESNPERQSLSSVGWRIGQSGVPPDRHCSLSSADCFPNLAQPTVEDLEPLAHRTLSGAHRTVRCPHQTVGSATRHAQIARPTVGSSDSLVHHRTVRWILAVRRRRIPESGQLTRLQPGTPDTVCCTTGQSGAPRLRWVLAAPAKSFPFEFSLILALRQIC
jgi:hypothetical protein